MEFMLWKKQSEGNGANFVDLLSGCPKISIKTNKYKFADLELEPVKNHEVSEFFCDQGREYARKKPINKDNFHQAIEFYNQSLKFAEANSDDMSLAYASRSACFFNLKKYEQCLVDIELAKKANYNGAHNLDERKNKCLNMKNEEPEFEPKLSFPCSEDRPSLANILNMQISEKYGRSVVTDSDIEVGQVVLMEEAFSTVGTNGDRSFCDTCLKFGQNFIPCPHCVDVIFCDEKCHENNNIHKMTCGSIYHRLNDRVIMLTIKTILCAMDAFPVAEDLIDKNTHDLEQGTTSQLRYGTFLKLLLAEPGPKDIEQLNDQYQYAMAIPAKITLIQSKNNDF